MIKIPLQDILFKIQEKTGKTEQELNEKIEAKLKQLSGLISREGAAHIIANELNVDLFSSLTGKLKIGKILAGMKNVETVGKVQRVFDTVEFQKGESTGKVRSLMMGDETGVIRVVVWNDFVDKLNELKEDDILKVIDAYVRENQGRRELHLGNNSKIEINPPGEIIEEVKQYVSTRKSIAQVQENDENIEILGTVVQAFEPRFFEVCPECNKRARPHQGEFVCDEHNKIVPAYSYVMNIVVDDGSEPEGSIRVVCFRNQAERLLQKSPDEILKFKENPAVFEQIKPELLGKIVKIGGRATKNKFFDRVEFVAQVVFLDPDPEREIKRLQDEIGSIENKE